ncbi:hypothetical protein LCGC14_0890000, partial [marine sediment metagenome]
MTTIDIFRDTAYGGRVDAAEQKRRDKQLAADTIADVRNYLGDRELHGWPNLIQDAAGGAGSLKKIGTGTLTLTGANTYTGETIIAGGSIIVGHANALKNSTVSINVNYYGLDVTTNTIDATIGALGGSGNLNLGSQTLTTGGNDASTTYSGGLSGTGPLTKIGVGTLTLSGNNTYTGGTTLRDGALSLGHTSALGTGTLTVAPTITWTENFDSTPGDWTFNGTAVINGGSVRLTQTVRL